MTTPPLNAAPVRQGPNQYVDAFFRSAAAVAIGVAGFWYPQWCDSQYAAFERHNHVDLDSRMGFLYMFSLPIILVFAMLATFSLARAFWGGSPSRRWGRIALGLVLAGLCWSPVAFVGFRMVQDALQASSATLWNQ
jgi:hypothetical protein